MIGFLGRRAVYSALIICILVSIGAFAVHLGQNYDVVRMQAGPLAARVMVMNGLTGIGFFIVVLMVLYTLRLRDAGKSMWWIVMGILPPLNLLAFLWMMFPEGLEE